MRERWGSVVAVVLAVVSAYGAGLAWMTHMHHRALQYLEPGRMVAFDGGYERLSDLTVIPVGVAGLLGWTVLLWLRPRGVPTWLVGFGLALQVSVFISRIWFWGVWAETVRETGSAWLADGTLHPDYVRYMDTNWVRIVIISAYALLAAGLLLRMTYVRAAANAGARV
ncbi:hypothetical protein [Nocardia sp. XZ_19_385]|uniref:hypothetical protein n=1 Tax=Nocardia sp. XZ_19_385 TaxID=2769488 RepID=UPI00188F5DB0|nr:hypothetical protein [Nocardia sp. XZ_19_385]